MRKSLTKIFWNIEVWAVQKHVNLVDLVKSFPTTIFMLKLASIQKRASPIKFAHLAEKSEKGSISNLSTKVQQRYRRELKSITSPRQGWLRKLSSAGSGKTSWAPTEATEVASGRPVAQGSPKTTPTFLLILLTLSFDPRAFEKQMGICDEISRFARSFWLQSCAFSALYQTGGSRFFPASW